MDWQEDFEAEIRRAEAARARRKEGQARVCARRAAGIVIAEHNARRGLMPQSGSAVDLLLQLLTESGTPADTLPLIDHLVQQVSTEFTLPAGVDLIADARRLRQLLLPD